MERLWLANISPGTSDDELKELLKKYAPELECTEIKREEGTGTRPGGADLVHSQELRFARQARAAPERVVLEGAQALLFDDDRLTLRASAGQGGVRRAL